MSKQTACLFFTMMISTLLMANGLAMSLSKQAAEEQGGADQQTMTSTMAPHNQRVEDEFVDMIIDETNKYLGINGQQKADSDVEQARVNHDGAIDEDELILNDLLLNSRDLSGPFVSRFFKQQQQHQQQQQQQNTNSDVMSLLKSKLNNHKPKQSQLSRQQNLNNYMNKILAQLNKVSANGDIKSVRAIKRAACGNLNGNPMYKWMCW